MKKMRILLAALFIAASFMNPTIAGAETAKHAKVSMRTSVSPQTVVDYLHGLGYDVMTWPTLQSDGLTYQCQTYKNATNYMTYTYCNATCIVGHDDVPM